MALDRAQVVQRIFTGGKGVRVTLVHIPTGIRIDGTTQESHMKLIKELLVELEKKVEIRKPSNG